MRGVTELQRKLTRIGQGGTDIARASVAAGLSTMARAARRASPGTVKTEIGFYIRENGDVVSGRAGLMQYPRRGVKKGPHGFFLDQGTRYIAARHMISNALSESIPKARTAMERAAARKLQSFIRQK